MRKPPEPPTFFVDADLGLRFYERISNDTRFSTRFHDHHFPAEGTDDEVWLRFIASKSWVGLTHDKRMRADHRPLIISTGVRLIVLVGRWTFAQQAENFIRQGRAVFAQASVRAVYR